MTFDFQNLCIHFLKNSFLKEKISWNIFVFKNLVFLLGHAMYVLFQF